jgi:voltage-gated potassium channel
VICMMPRPLIQGSIEHRELATTEVQHDVGVDAASAPMESVTGRQRRRLLARGLLRALATTVVMVTLYYLLPLDHRSDTYVFVVLTLGIGLLAGMIVWQVRAIEASDHPRIRAVQSLASTTPLFLLLFASTYLFLSRSDPAMFTEQLTRADALYFTVTIFATVGFGDISAQAETARIVVTIQMLLDLVVLGLGVQVILGAVKRGTARQATDA